MATTMTDEQAREMINGMEFKNPDEFFSSVFPTPKTFEQSFEEHLAARKQPKEMKEAPKPKMEEKPAEQPKEDEVKELEEGKPVEVSEEETPNESDVEQISKQGQKDKARNQSKWAELAERRKAFDADQETFKRDRESFTKEKEQHIQDKRFYETEYAESKRFREDVLSGKRPDIVQMNPELFIQEAKSLYEQAHKAAREGNEQLSDRLKQEADARYETARDLAKKIKDYDAQSQSNMQRLAQERDHYTHQVGQMIPELTQDKHPVKMRALDLLKGSYTDAAGKVINTAPLAKWLNDPYNPLGNFYAGQLAKILVENESNGMALTKKDQEIKELKEQISKFNKQAGLSGSKPSAAQPKEKSYEELSSLDEKEAYWKKQLSSMR